MRVNLATQVLLAMVLGAAAGVFFGDLVAFLKVAGQAYIMLLQMTVMPFIAVSLIACSSSEPPSEDTDLSRTPSADETRPIAPRRSTSRRAPPMSCTARPQTSTSSCTTEHTSGTPRPWHRG